MNSDTNPLNDLVAGGLILLPFVGIAYGWVNPIQAITLYLAIIAYEVVTDD